METVVAAQSKLWGRSDYPVLEVLWCFPRPGLRRVNACLLKTNRAVHVCVQLWYIWKLYEIV